jgi:hypothetical protein
VGCGGQVRRLWLQLWEGRRKRDHPVGWVCTGCGASRIDADAFDDLYLVRTGGGAVALRKTQRLGDAQGSLDRGMDLRAERS